MRRARSATYPSGCDRPPPHRRWNPGAVAAAARRRVRLAGRCVLLSFNDLDVVLNGLAEHGIASADKLVPRCCQTAVSKAHAQVRHVLAQGRGRYCAS